MNLNPQKIAKDLRRRADKIGEVADWLMGVMGDDKEMQKHWSALLATTSFMRVDAEEIETGLCCCRHVPDVDDTPCQRCNDTGVSEFVADAELPPFKEG